ncbi:endonuclease [Winogradskyella bathintestinalis]|uniref:Endonuclease n=1 Tax=Winogradskyella bathintestinalis TaxID=3035208 RepID=A0ABT7ZTC0_9FLAO|nr:endonuclease [Winogradskyella bathintestinalis]MDN3492240.1 endonuclease [Winogradskyella bathintestinalis]
MKHIYLSFSFLFLFTISSFAQLMPPAELQSYYSGVNFNNTGMDLFDDLATKTISKHTNFLSYGEAREVLKIIDLMPSSSSHVLLIYGFSNDTCTTNSSNDNDHRTRDKDDFGGGATCEWNREHTYPKSLGNPNLGTSGPGSDVHHLRASDVQRNGSRGSKRFSSGSGISGDSNGGWYPGDEWKGDVARMMMYMYLRYGNRCLPVNVGNGSINNIDSNMIQLFLDWNAEDPVSPYETVRNNYLGNASNFNAQGNRNPFIDNPYLATLIWGGTASQNTWGDTPVDTEAPTNPTDLVASNSTDNSIDLNWTASTDNIGVSTYDIYIDNNYAFSSNNTSTTASGLSANTNYCFTIKAKDASGNTSGFSNEACELTTDNGTIGEGSDCLAETFENLDTSIGSYQDVSWTGDDGGSWSATKARTDQTISDAAITIDVRGNNGGSLTLPTVSGGIGSLTLTTQRKYSGSTGDLDLYVNGDLIAGIPFGTDPITTTISNINIEGNITVVISGEDGGRVAIDDLSYTCYSPLSLEEFNLDTIKLHPNPVESNLTIDLKSNVNTNIEIFDILGKRVYKNIINKTSNINLQTLKTGIYIVKISQNNSTITKKLVKQ